MNGKQIPKEKDKPRKERKKSVSKLKRELDQIFSQYIRRKYANEKGEVSCYTCERRLQWKEAQCGHFASRVYLATRFREDNCRPQCVGCNVFGNGRIAVFATKLDAELGEGTTSAIYKAAQELTKWTAKDYQEKIDHYKQLLTTLK